MFSAESVNNFFIHNPIFTVSVGLSALIATLLYLFGVGGMIGKEIKRRRMQHRLASLKDHYLLCGFGRVGQQVAKEFASEDEPFVILEREEEKLRLAKDKNWLFLAGDVAVDETLFEKANIEKAKGIIISVGTDADAIFMAISARALKPDIFIVARASSLEAADKLSKIGVNRVALPYQIGGYHMATMALRPGVVDFLDLLVDEERDELEMEEYLVAEGHPLEGQTLDAAGLIKEGVAILALRRANGKAVVNPSGSVQLTGGDRIVVMGPAKEVEAMGKNIIKDQPKSKDDSKDGAKPSVVMADVKPSPFAEKEDK